MAEIMVQERRRKVSFWRQFPWWFVAAGILLAALFLLLTNNAAYAKAFEFIFEGLPLTLVLTAVSFVFALTVGFVVGLASRSRFMVVRNLAFFYLAVSGGIPAIIMIFFIAFVAVPAAGDWLAIDARQITATVRFAIALTFVYGAVFGDVFRLSPGDRGPLTSWRLARVLVAVLITLMALLKDTSLATFVAVQEIAQQTRLFAGSTFQFNEAYIVAILLYIALTLPLRLLSQLLEQRFTLSGSAVD